MTGPDVFVEVWEERERAHTKHGPNSIEEVPADDLRFLATLVEEVGEVAQTLTYDKVAAAVFDGVVPLQRTREELIQVAAVATAWADAITRFHLDTPIDLVPVDPSPEVQP